MATRKVVESIGTFATAFGISRDVLRRILSESRVQPEGQRSGHPTYSLSDVFLAVTREEEPEQMNPHARYALARAIETEDRIRRTRGELVPALEVEQTYGRLFKLTVRAFETAIDGLERSEALTASQVAFLERHFDRVRIDLAAEIRDGE